MGGPVAISLIEFIKESKMDVEILGYLNVEGTLDKGDCNISERMFVN